jgi:chromate transporter
MVETSMTDREGAFAHLAVQFVLLSLLSFGGVNSIVTEIQRVAVENAHWMNDRQFATYFAIGQAAPGPNILIASLVGWHVAGVPGAVIATLGMCGPSAVMVCFLSGAWERWRHSEWRRVVQRGLVPVTTGLVCASGFVLARAADHNAVTTCITLGTAAFVYFTRFNPLWALGASAVLGLAGLA